MTKGVAAVISHSILQDRERGERRRGERESR